ncbi:hypothetical protein DU500_07070 [Haloplanus rubicundus]|uniref:Uncharacterized protein n=1 Tax=Haloplanus rubicundus TaxID=1547898 RepID=A0A345EBM9_9EURY|nr:hypothetical protein [Haloplanus rubicundus]AXG06222.1 hypothetical protein DU500_07070 [Haloplanus rubicundus]AXG09601.1 hypothetical protein DU484_06800 [Haloplanus rubicundus]
MTDLDSLLRWPLDTDGGRHTLLVGTLLVATLPLAVPGVGPLLAAAVRFYGGLVAVGVWNGSRPADDATDGGSGTGATRSAATADPA